MAASNHSVIDESWPINDLERVDVCPYCGSMGRNIAFQDVQDWSFYCAPGKWTYWDCEDCGTLYLDPRPTKASIGRAYSLYYTHGASSLGKKFSIGKTLIRHLCYFAWYGIELRPRLALPYFMFPMLSVFRRHIDPPSFFIKELNKLPKGKVVDVGCGDGMFLDVAKQLGWKTLGIELDPEAAKVVRASGHEVINDTYEACSAFDNQIDCIICSHVLEHVHDPKALLFVLSRALKMGGTALISLPNAGSIVRRAVQENWRGLEAPRHLAIPRVEGLLEVARAAGFEKQASFVSKLETLDRSLAIAQYRGVDVPALLQKMKFMQDETKAMSEADSDFINLVLKKVAAPNDSS